MCDCLCLIPLWCLQTCDRICGSSVSTFVTQCAHHEEKGHRSGHLEPYLNLLLCREAALCIPFLGHRQHRLCRLVCTINKYQISYPGTLNILQSKPEKPVFLGFVLIAIELIWVGVSLGRVFKTSLPFAQDCSVLSNQQEGQNRDYHYPTCRAQILVKVRI